MAGTRPSPSSPPGADTAPANGALQLADPSWTYAPAPEARDIVSIAPEYGLYINGEFAAAADGRQFTTVNPAT
jgi:aldehyde dehydrogenase (NAD+)